MVGIPYHCGLNVACHACINMSIVVGASIVSGRPDRSHIWCIQAIIGREEKI